MGWENFYKMLEDFFFNLFDKWILVGILIFLIIGSIVGGIIFVAIKLKAKEPENKTPEQLFIEQHAPQYCSERNYQLWRFKNNSVSQFECYNQTEPMKKIEEFLNMSSS